MMQSEIRTVVKVDLVVTIGMDIVELNQQMCNAKRKVMSEVMGTLEQVTETNWEERCMRRLEELNSEKLNKIACMQKIVLI